MKTPLIYAALLALLLPGCALLKLTPQPYTVDWERTGSPKGRIGYVTAEYQNADRLREEAEQRAANMKVPGNVATFPRGGRLLLHISQPSIESANLRNWKFVVRDTSGKILSERQGAYSSPMLPSRYNTYWTNITAVEIPVDLTAPVVVEVYDQIMGERWDFKIAPNPEYAKLPTDK